MMSQKPYAAVVIGASRVNSVVVIHYFACFLVKHLAVEERTGP